MMNFEVLFSNDKFGDLVRDFSLKLPKELMRHPLTAGYAYNIDRLDLTNTLNSKFTIAVVGQMKAGKSTLLNSLIGKNLAPVGITETTATINWFRHGLAKDSKIFRVHWLDNSSSDFDISKINSWIGEHENIKTTKCIDFFADSSFLLTSNIVDTPGTRSTIEQHQRATEGFLSQKLEDQTLTQGASADAVVYVLPKNIRQDDLRLLDLFGDKTRLPGSSAYNSIAVIQKWEDIEEGLAWETVSNKCQRIEKLLDGKVAGVIATSGLLASVLSKTNDDIWQQLLDFVSHCSSTELEGYIETEDSFPDPEIKKAIDWLVLPLCCRYAKHNNFASAQNFIDGLYDISGINKLKELLEKHFITKAKIIKLGTVLSKAMEIGNEVMLKINYELEKQHDLKLQGYNALKAVSADPNLKHVKEYIQESINSTEVNTHLLYTMQRQLDDISFTAKNSFEFLENDIIWLKALEQADEDYDYIDRRELQFLFGIDGTSIENRLMVKSISSDNMLKITNDRLTKWAQKRAMYSSKVYQHAMNVCRKIIQCIEGSVSE
jgi:hypothetical protein